MRHEVLDIAAGCDQVDVDALREMLDDGRARGPMMRTYAACRSRVQGSPHFLLSDGTDIHNPGISMHQVGEPGAGFLVVDGDQASIYDDLVRRAAGA